MSRTIRKQLISEIETLRGSRVITFVTSSRPNIQSDIETSDIRKFRAHLEDICHKCKSLDLFLYSYGGEIEAAWSLVNLLREYDINFNVLIPYHARSAATMIALGAKEIVMGKMASLGPIDPTIRIAGGDFDGMEISVSDIDSFEDFIRDEYQVEKPEEKMKAFTLLGEDISPILLGKAYRNYLETKKDAKKLLQRNINNPKKVKSIVNMFIKEISTHNHSISRLEAKESGLNVTYASEKLEKLLWKLYIQYERVMQMDIPYIDEPPAKSSTREVIFTLIESQILTNKKVGLQKFKKLNFPKGSYLVSGDSGAAVYTPDAQTIPILPTGQIMAKDGFIYDKTEDIYWVK